MRTEIVTTLRRQATKLLEELRESKDPILITEHGKPAAYLVDVDSYELLEQRLRILDGIARGERAVLEKRVLSDAEARRTMKKWLD
jgi:prevent-host-death family protein